ncbi:Fic/DOC family protein [Kitasatospora phosalacinea]|uniref:protein adenylyltransferase n=1 Tax=Kitasatospora phosalacinea TaxID=2065 RepID=A0A9W6USW5_9ACTN|nr:Fic family protein [Kitasatospora phosalacinea]GLW58557.1 cell division protein Fic [Kitasatospora phosalacinea]
MADPYTDPGSGVLRNRLGITDPQALAAAEADITAARLTRIAETPVPGRYDLAHLQTFHREVFGSIYPWAGDVRSIEIAKGNTQFCLVRMIPGYADDTFGRLARRQDYLRGLDRDQFLTGLADLYGDVNALHPFREGNGRVQRAFLGQLAAAAGHPIDWTQLDPDRNELASIASFNGNSGPLRAMLADLTVEQPAPRTTPTARATAPAQLIQPPPVQTTTQPTIRP